MSKSSVYIYILLIFFHSIAINFAGQSAPSARVDSKGDTMASPVLSQLQLVAEIQRVLGLHKQGFVEDAIEGYEKIIPMIDGGATKVSLLGNVGALQMNQGNWEKAMEHFSSAVEIAPENAQAHFNLAVILTSKLNQHAKALKHCALAIRLDKSSHKAYHLMGNILQNLGKPDDAEKYFQLAESLAGKKSISDFRNVDRHSETPEGSLSESSEISKLFFRLWSSLESAIANDGVIQLQDRTYTIKVISRLPLAFVVDNFLTDQECSYICDKAVDSLEKSFLMGNNIKPVYVQSNNDMDFARNKNASIIHDKTATSITQPVEEDSSLYRSSYNTWLSQDEILSKVQERLASLLSIPLGYIKQKSEDLQVVKYNIGGQFKPHQDSSAFHPRLLTALMYLNDLEQQGVNHIVHGGETWFPFANSDEDLSHISVEECVLRSLNTYEDYVANGGERSLSGIKIEPRKGRILVFFNYLNSGKIDPLAVHSGLPIKINNPSQVEALNWREISKWIANYWLDYDESVLKQFAT